MEGFMKYILGVLLTSATAFAANPTVEITSFYFVGQSNRLAEICGVVKDAGKPVAVRVVSDYNTDRPGVYNALAGTDGLFCTTLVSYSGRAMASIFVLGTTATTEATASPDRTQR
jgi:hypothetical protein